MNPFKAARTRAHRLQNGRCFYCDHPTWLRDLDGFARLRGLSPGMARHFQATAEHLVPQHAGGKGGANVVMACRWCNGRRHARKGPAPSPEAYRCQVAARVAAGRWWLLPPAVRAVLPATGLGVVLP